MHSTIKHLYFHVYVNPTQSHGLTIVHNNVEGKEMQTSGMIGGVLFVIGIAAIFTSGGNTMMMVIGDAAVAGAGIAIVALGNKKSA